MLQFGSATYFVSAATYFASAATYCASSTDPSVKGKLLELGFEIVANTPEQLSAFQAAEFARWKKVIEVGKITAD